MPEGRTYHILSSDSDFFIREAYNSLRTNLFFSFPEQEGCKVLAITSTMQKEGKTTTSLNTTIAIAESGKKVLLVDCDLRKTKLGSITKSKVKTWLSNVLIDSSLLGSSIFKYTENIDVLTAGSIPPNPSELLGSERMKMLINVLKERYDYIILDTPPVDMVTDAMVLAPVYDGVLLVIRMGHTLKPALTSAIEQLTYSGAKIIGTVLNGVDREQSSYYSSRYRYGGYRYSRYKYSDAYAPYRQSPKKEESDND